MLSLLLWLPGHRCERAEFEYLYTLHNLRSETLCKLTIDIFPLV
jgi:hypothetical protein